MSLRFLLCAITALLSFALAQHQATIYWPIISPTKTTPWVLGEKNMLAWRVASDTGVQVFDVQLHNLQHGVMEGAIRIAKNVPMTRLKGGYRNFGGEIEVDIDGTMPTGDGFVIAFVESLHGQVYTISDPFTILPSNEKPSNFTDRPYGLPAPSETAILHHRPNPTLPWALTLDGPGAVPTTGA